MALISQVKGLKYKLEDIGMMVSTEDMVLALMIGLDVLYNLFIISHNFTPDVNCIAIFLAIAMGSKIVICTLRYIRAHFHGIYETA